NFLFYYLKNIFEYVIGKKIKSGYDQDFVHDQANETTKIKWIGYENRDKYNKDLNHSKKRPKNILLITDASHPFICDYGSNGFKLHVLFYDFKNPFDYFLNDVMDKLVNGKLVNGKLVIDKPVN
ncbi:4932_t:CDS:2, partial [Dentiscutata heterogama]